MDLRYHLEQAREQEASDAFLYATYSYQNALDEAFQADDDASCAEILIRQARCYEHLGNFREACVSYNAAWRHAVKLGNEELAIEIIGYLQDAERNGETKTKFDRIERQCHILCDNHEVARAERGLQGLMRTLNRQRECSWFPAATRLLFAECKMRGCAATSFREALACATQASALAVEWSNQSWLLNRIDDVTQMCRVKIGLLP